MVGGGGGGLFGCIPAVTCTHIIKVHPNSQTSPISSRYASYTTATMSGYVAATVSSRSLCTLFYETLSTPRADLSTKRK